MNNRLIPAGTACPFTSVCKSGINKSCTRPANINNDFACPVYQAAKSNCSAAEFRITVGPIEQTCNTEKQGIEDLLASLPKAKEYYGHGPLPTHLRNK